MGAGCIIAAGAEIGDKTSVKRSVIGPNCVLGNNVKVRARFQKRNTVRFESVGVAGAFQKCLLQPLCFTPLLP